MRNLQRITLAGVLALGVAASAGAATLSFTGSLTYGIGTAYMVGSVAGQVEAITLGGHLSSLVFAGGEIGPVSASVPVSPSRTVRSMRLSGVSNRAGILKGLSGGAPLGAGAMGLQGMAKICVLSSDCIYNVPVPFTPTGTPQVGVGIGGTQMFGGSVALTLQHAPWTIGQPVMTIHTPNSTINTPALPGGFAHGPASLPSSAARNSGVLQLVTPTKAYTSLETVFPEVPVFTLLNLHFFRTGATTTTTTTSTTTTTTTTTTLPANWKVVMCHVSEHGRQTTRLVTAGDIERHLEHGDSLGGCPDSAKIIVCHVRKNGKLRTLLASSRKAQRHLDHGDALGECRP